MRPLLRTGKVLLIAGSGNDREQLRRRQVPSLLWDPSRRPFKKIPHAARTCSAPATSSCPTAGCSSPGGTRRYEVLTEDVKRAAGVMAVKNE